MRTLEGRWVDLLRLREKEMRDENEDQVQWTCQGTSSTVLPCHPQIQGSHRKPSRSITNLTCFYHPERIRQERRCQDRFVWTNDLTYPMSSDPTPQW
jgi:hypothetical protein